MTCVLLEHYTKIHRIGCPQFSHGVDVTPPFFNESSRTSVFASRLVTVALLAKWLPS